MKADLKKAIDKSGLKKKFIAAGIGISQNYLSMIIKDTRKAPEAVKRIYAFLNQNKKAA